MSSQVTYARDNGCYSAVVPIARTDADYDVRGFKVESHSECQAGQVCVVSQPIGNSCNAKIRPGFVKAIHQ